MDNKNRIRQEYITKIVYGETFAKYNRMEFLEFLRPLKVRLKLNGIHGSAFKGKRCLDAGCGGGRGSVLMAQAGAKEVISYDLSEKNIETTLSNARLFGLKNIHVRCGSLLDLPYGDEYFDVVWCNGVLHHTVNPDKALCETTRVLKVGGRLWLYLYGSGGLYWYMVDFFRSWLRDVSIHEAMLILSAIKMPSGRIAEYIDDWYVPNLKRYTDRDVSSRLEELGVSDIHYLKRGMSYDTSERRGDVHENRWMGGGDLRYWARKTSGPLQSGKNVLPDVDGKGSYYKEHSCVTAFECLFESLRNASCRFEKLHGSLGLSFRVITAARLHFWLRERYTDVREFEGAEFRNEIKQAIKFFENA